MVSAGLGVEWMEGETCFSALTGVVVSGGDWTMAEIDLDSTGWVLDDVPAVCALWVVGSNDGGRGGGGNRGGATCQGGTVSFREGN